MPTVNASMQKHDHKARRVIKIDAFAYIKDSTALLVTKGIGVLDKQENDTFDEALDLRNCCGHPGKYESGIKKVSGFIENVVSIPFS